MYWRYLLNDHILFGILHKMFQSWALYNIPHLIVKTTWLIIRAFSFTLPIINNFVYCVGILIAASYLHDNYVSFGQIYLDCRFLLLGEDTLMLLTVCTIFAIGVLYSRNDFVTQKLAIWLAIMYVNNDFGCLDKKRVKRITNDLNNGWCMHVSYFVYCFEIVRC